MLVIMIDAIHIKNIIIIGIVIKASNQVVVWSQWGIVINAFIVF